MATETGRKMVYRLAEGGANMVDLLGSKGAHASEMARIGIPVPPGFVITTEASLEYYREGRQFPQGLWDSIVANVHDLETETGRKFGDADNPLVVSVRSGAAVSMPGMMDTILNMGMTDATVDGVARMMNDERPALDAYRRLIQGFGSVVLGIDKDRFEVLLEEAKTTRGLDFDYQLGPSALRELVSTFKAVARRPPASQCPKIRGRCSTRLSRPSLTRGTTPARLLIVSTRASPTTWARVASSWRWSLATWGPTAVRECSLPGAPPQARSSSTASS